MEESNEHVEKIDDLLDRLEADKQILDELALDLEVDSERIERMDKAVWDALGTNRRRPDPSLLDLLREISTTQGVLVTLLEQLIKMLPQPEPEPRFNPTLGSEWKNQSVSTGTLRPEDLMVAYMEMLEQHWPEKAIGLKLAMVNTGWPDDAAGRLILTEASIERALYQNPEDVSEWMSRMSEALDQIAPDGCYFGSHPGDGADIGFWVGEDLSDEEDARGTTLDVAE